MPGSAFSSAVPFTSAAGQLVAPPVQTAGSNLCVRSIVGSWSVIVSAPVPPHTCV